MTTITLEAIKAEQDKIKEMIAAFEAKAPRIVVFPESEIELCEGEHYAGIILGKDGQLNHHLILMSGEAESINWDATKEWAVKVGGELPTRQEQALLYANLKEQFKPHYYWSGEQHAAHSTCAWYQDFDDGNQNDSFKSAERRARVVRRLSI